MRFKHFRQFDEMDCGATCLKMVANYHGAKYPNSYLRDLMSTTRLGTNIGSIEKAANEIGFKTLISTGTVGAILKESLLPAILYWNPNHFVVLYHIDSNEKPEFFIADPAFDKNVIDEEEFSKKWITDANVGLLIFLEPSEDFEKKYEEFKKTHKSIFRVFFTSYFSIYRKQFAGVIAITLLTALVNLSFPILTQKIVDFGIPRKDFSFIFLILIFQIFAFVSSSLFDLFKNRLVFILAKKMNINMLSAFLNKLTRLSIKYFENKMVSDITQRVVDHSRIEQFLSNNVIVTLFSLFNIITFSFLILKYDLAIFAIFCVFTTIAIIWMASFIVKRKKIDYKKFQAYATTSNSIYEVVYGMKELKLNNAQTSKITDWKSDQEQIHTLNEAALKLEQKQSIGNVLITQIRSALVTFYCSFLVIRNELTIGEMISVSYMLGQLSAPFTQFFEFIKGWNEAVFSFERINEVNLKPEEDLENLPSHSGKFKEIKSFSKISIKNVFFKYEPSFPSFVLENINLDIRRGQTIAFVGNSGSGKTTLLKMLIKFYTPLQGEIFVDDSNLMTIKADCWRNLCGAVLQDGYIFSTSIIKNIALDSSRVNLDKIQHVCKLANIADYIESLPQKYHTKIGNAGIGLSGGQLQRLLIARALYKEPDILFFDEATSSLDTENESVIMKNILDFCKEKTLIIIAHRLSTVKNADLIVVFDAGKIIEYGNHQELIAKRGNYYRLISNQLELSQ